MIYFKLYNDSLIRLAQQEKQNDILCSTLKLLWSLNLTILIAVRQSCRKVQHGKLRKLS